MDAFYGEEQDGKADSTAEDNTILHMVFNDDFNLFTEEGFEQRLLGFEQSFPSDKTMENYLLSGLLTGTEAGYSSETSDMSVDSSGTIAEDFHVGPGRGHRGPRGPRRKRKPYDSMFWKKYILLAEESPADDPDSIWEESSYVGTSFRR
jgi:hypothetical protein